MVIDLLKYQDRVAGLLCCDLHTTEPFLLLAKVVVLATGGCGQLYSQTTTSEDNTGEGLIMAWEAGAELMDLEFVQFYPTAQCYPKLPGLGPCAPAFIRIRSGARLFNNRNEDFMDKLMPGWRFKATRDFIARAIYREVKEGRGSEHGGVYMKITDRTPEEIEELFSIGNYFKKALKLGFDLRKDTIETTVKSHFYMGGVRIDINCQTAVPGLLACGEAAAGIHGANRLGGNALTEVLVTGARAGDTAAAIIAETQHAPQGEMESLALDRFRDAIKVLHKEKGIRPRQLKQRLQQTMWDKVSLIRDGQGLEEALKEIENLTEEAETNLALQFRGKVYNKELVDYWEVRRMVKLAS